MCLLNSSQRLCKSRITIDRLKQLNQLNNSANLCKLNKYSIVKCKTMDNKPNESRNTHPSTHKQTNKQTTLICTCILERSDALRLIEKTLLFLVYLIGCASDWLNNYFDIYLKRIQPALRFSGIKYAFRFIKPKAKYPPPPPAKEIRFLKKMPTNCKLRVAIEKRLIIHETVKYSQMCIYMYLSYNYD